MSAEKIEWRGVAHWHGRAVEAERSLAALRVELQAGRDERDTAMRSSEQWREDYLRANDRTETVAAALQDAQEALREGEPKIRKVLTALGLTYGTHTETHKAIREASDALARIARAVLVEGADGLADSNWCNRP